jgi:hypothetical protein
MWLARFVTAPEAVHSLAEVSIGEFGQLPRPVDPISDHFFLNVTEVEKQLQKLERNGESLGHALATGKDGGESLGESLGQALATRRNSEILGHALATGKDA